MTGQAPRHFVSAGSSDTIAVREAAAGEIDAVMLVMDAAFPPSFGEAWTRSQCAGILPMAGVLLRVAEWEDRRVAGFSLMRIVGDEAELLLIAVDPGVQHKGYGSALIDDFLQVATARGANRLHLEVREGNGAIALYEAAGFALAGRRRAYYRGQDGETRDALTLVWNPPEN